ncbi:MAG: ORF6N domain-containing protein [Bacteroidales bacterium]|nr:ORF6N domain-containing protein [Bacteroidales bacterium]
MDLEVIKSKIYEIRGQRVMLDRDLAQMYGVETKVLNQAVRRNLERFPEDFMFMLTQTECKSLEISVRSQFVTSKSGGNRYSSLAFTEQGVAMLSSVLRSKTAIQINISIMRAFVTMRSFAFSISAVTSELTEFKERMLQIEQCCKDNADAVSDLSEDMQQELDDIYLALSQLVAKQKENDGLKERQKIGFKK